MAVYMMFGRKNPMHNIAGPPSPSWIFGHLRQLLLASNFGDYEYRWLRAYGPIYRLKGCLGQDRLMVSDPIALQHVLNSPDFGQAPVLLNMIRLLFGEKCVLSVQGETHKRLRAGMNIGFTAAAVRNYQSVFEQVANEISERLEESADLSVDICPLLSIATLSAVSEGVLGHPTQDLGKEFVETTCQIMHLSSSQSPIQLITDALSASLPRWVMGATIHLPTATFRALHRERYLANEVGERIVQEKLEVARQGLERNNDIFSRLLNPDPSDKTRDVLAGADIAAQTAIVMIAGQDTTANTLAFGFMELARDPEFQERLRAEIHAYSGRGTVAFDNMPLLNAFIKESLRFYPAEALTDRVALQDTVMPLSEAITTVSGKHISQVSIRKGQLVTIAIGSYHRLVSRWGADAHEFKPSRWVEGQAYHGDSEALGPYANLLSFLGGPRTCLGWRFALLEMQVIICELVGKFSFAPPDDGDEGKIRWGNTMFPMLSNGKKGAVVRVARIL